MNAKWIFANTVCLALLLCISNRTNAQIRKPDAHNEKHPSASLLMDAKLSNCEQLLRGLVTEDFESISKASRKLKKIAEAAHWPTSIDEVYQHHSFEFRRQCDKLIKSSENQDIQTAHFNFLRLTTSCVDCHTHVRSRFKIKKSLVALFS